VTTPAEEIENKFAEKPLMDQEPPTTVSGSVAVAVVIVVPEAVAVVMAGATGLKLMAVGASLTLVTLTVIVADAVLDALSVAATPTVRVGPTSWLNWAES
jgi:hypothetical protein